MGKVNQLAKDHDEGWLYFLNRLKSIAEIRKTIIQSFLFLIFNIPENPENVKISEFLYFIRSNILGYDI